MTAGGRFAVGAAGDHHRQQVRRSQHIASDGLQLVGLILMDTMIEEADQVRGQRLAGSGCVIEGASMCDEVLRDL